MGNFIKIDRKILKWEWWSDINTFRLFFYMLVSAYWKDGNYKGVEIKRGSFPSSISELSRETNLSTMEIRTALKHLQSTGEVTTNQQATNKQDNTNLTSNLTSKKTNKFTVFTVVNYDLYQSDNKQDNTNLTSNLTENQQANNTQLNKQVTRPILKEDKNIIKKEINNNNICSNSDDLNESDKQKKKKTKLTEEESEELLKNFEIIYNSYPRKVGRTAGFELYKQWLKGKDIGGTKIKLTNKQIWLAIARYKKYLEDNETEKQYIKQFDTFMRKPILDYVGEDEQ